MDPKVQQYEEFVNEKLMMDLRKVEARLDKLLLQLNEFQTLQNLIKKLEDKKIPDRHMRVYSDLGHNFRVQANIPDPTTIFINIGLETYVEMDLPQASKFVAARAKGLEAGIQSSKTAQQRIKANVRIMLEGLRKIQHLDFTA
ncbi:hypothetical protein RvY_15859-1 [Ramazzottius varieornatus]|uniref:Uncharacterized protein n=1 Tax=Ramazzottius varieornatus TaxID=947166 RepID=A0A1D1VXH7_RAMVA|nr:hypothetical protein RvY_15859-1 [Ramazzottius varieornatus]